MSEGGGVRRMARPAPRLALALVLAVSALVVFLLPTPRARAQTAALIGTATATGSRGTYTVPNFLIVSTIFDGGGPISQAVFNTSGDATGFGSLPYPGDTVVNAPGLASVGTGQSIPFSYPFFVQATKPTTPEASESDPSGQYSLKATATDNGATGFASMGTGASPSGATSTSSVTTDDSGKVTAVADATVHGIDFGGVLKIAAATSHSETVFAPTDAKPVTKASTTVEGVTVAGQAVLVGPDGIGVPGQSVATAPVADALNAALKQAGLSVKTVTTQPVEGGGATSALQVTQVGALPVPGSPTGTMVYDFASTSSSIVSGTGGAPVGQAVPVAPSAGESAPEVPTDAGLTSPAVDGSGSAAVPSAGGLPARLGGVRSQPATSVAPQLLARDLRSVFQSLYVVAAVAAALVLAGSALWRGRAVRVTWIPDR